MKKVKRRFWKFGRGTLLMDEVRVLKRRAGIVEETVRKVKLQSVLKTKNQNLSIRSSILCLDLHVTMIVPNVVPRPPALQLCACYGIEGFLFEYKKLQ